jgi:hypothetical protein
MLRMRRNSVQTHAGPYYYNWYFIMKTKKALENISLKKANVCLVNSNNYILIK